MSSFVILTGQLLALDTLICRNGTFNSTEDERSQLEDRIKGITGNETSDVITEDNGEFFSPRFFISLPTRPAPTGSTQVWILQRGINSFTFSQMMWWNQEEISLYQWCVFWMLLQKTFRSRRQSSQAECVNETNWRSIVTACVGTISTRQWCRWALRTGVCSKMSLGMNLYDLFRGVKLKHTIGQHLKLEQSQGPTLRFLKENFLKIWKWTFLYGAKQVLL